MIRVKLIVLFVAFAFVVQAQQLPHFSQFVINDFVLNPGVTGKNNFFEAKSVVRNQWVGITDAPRTYVLSLHGPIKSKNFGVGGSVFTDITGPTRRTGFNASYAYHLKIKEGLKLGLGVTAGLLQFAIDGSKLNLQNANDVALANGYVNDLIPDFGFGAYLHSEKFYVGVAAPQIYPARLKFFDYTTAGRIVTHFYAIAGYKWNASDDFLVEPMLAVKQVAPVPVQADIGARVSYKKTVWLGTTYRTKDAVNVMVGYNFKENLTIGYSYDITTSNLKRYNTGTHEVLLAIRFYKAETN
ncbi:MAG: type IX secretion system membrane protein PorP/SprF [Bacteroidetes bacterium]|nr:type IX secretion system membrane protein PorP/SprF [Bacteroidota bacterium]